MKLIKTQRSGTGEEGTILENPGLEEQKEEKGGTMINFRLFISIVALLLVDEVVMRVSGSGSTGSVTNERTFIIQSSFQICLRSLSRNAKSISKAIRENRWKVLSAAASR